MLDICKPYCYSIYDCKIVLLGTKMYYPEVEMAYLYQTNLEKPLLMLRNVTALFRLEFPWYIQ